MNKFRNSFKIKLEALLQHKSALIVWAFIITYVLFFCLICYLKYHSFAYNDIDLSIIERTFWNTIHGNLTTDNLGEAAIFNGGHLFLIIFLLAPVYAIWAHPLTLLFMQTIALALPAYFIYLLARNKIDANFGLYFALAYLLYPGLAYVNLFEFHVIALAPLFLIPMFIFFEQRKFWPFILFMLLSLACKEDVSLVIFGLGVYAAFRYVHLTPPFIKRKDWKWIIFPLLSGALWFIIATQFIQPYFSLAEIKGLADSRGALGFYGWLGSTPGEMIKNIFLHPIQVLRGISIPAKNTYLLHLFSPLAFLSIFGFKEMIVVLFALLESLLSQRGTHFSIHYQYPALVMPFIFISAIFGLRNLLRFKLFNKARLYLLAILFCCTLFSAWKIGPLFKLPWAQWQRDRRDVLKEKFLQLVPPDASVAASFELATRLTHRPKLFFIYHINILHRSPQMSYVVSKYAEQADCLLVDFFDPLTYIEFYEQDSDRHLYSFLNENNWNVAQEINNLVLFIKGRGSAEPLVATVDRFPEQLLGQTGGNQEIKFVGYQIQPKEVLGYPVLHFNGYLECQRRTGQRYVLQLDFYSKFEQKLVYRHHFFAADRIYPTKRWKKWEKVKITQNILLPQTVGPQDCLLLFSFVQVK